MKKKILKALQTLELAAIKVGAGIDYTNGIRAAIDEVRRVK